MQPVGRWKVSHAIRSIRAHFLPHTNVFTNRQEPLSYRTVRHNKLPASRLVIQRRCILGHFAKCRHDIMDNWIHVSASVIDMRDRHGHFQTFWRLEFPKGRVASFKKCVNHLKEVLGALEGFDNSCILTV